MGMIKDDDLPLLSWSPPTAEIVPFPCANRVGKVRRVASVMFERKGKERAITAYWSQTVDVLTSQMERAGLSPVTIALELCDFEEAVNAELARLELVERYRR